MYTLLIISVSAIALSSCSSTQPHCDAYGSLDQKVVLDNMWALPSYEVMVIADMETRDNQPQPELPTSSANDFACIREDKEVVGKIREA